ncbi:PP2C family protein-serine/threonine phosphatase [Maridesulfovibrio salexigens]|uniref:Protein serine/threonine phosphatase n=1 Tax=Maridesulfovibrio salexigens (strain ATCC 14822 / DSM 2638 / NCIMB 8403 / VKM B-1763) TaxID=526222 RepID=C6BTS3_MARSD|nr:SpoIIE family protein phosphatase [Maridesulfovibrio salexigens]ACS79853.1 protein serine/threonine phosphatase [Maridesulfovibrio salexigens DSM 2638]
MKIRFKLLLLLLTVSILPLILVQAGVLDSLRSLSDEIGGEVRKELVNKSSVELKRLVEDHARVLSKQRRIVELNLQQVSAELSAWIEDGNEFSLPEVFLGSNSEQGDIERLEEKYEQRDQNMMHGSYVLDFDSVRYTAAHSSSRSSILPYGTSDAVLPLLKAVELKNPELTLWIRAVFNSGESLVYPATTGMRMSMHKTVPIINKNPVPSWSLPQKDLLTGRTVLTASLGVFVKKEAVGSVSIDVPLDTLLHGYNHLDVFSHNIDSLLVRLEPNGNGTSGVEVVAKEVAASSRKSMMHMWEPPSTQMLLSSTDATLFSRFHKFLEAGKSGVMSMPYNGRDSIWAFSAPDARGVSLVLILPHDDVVAPADKAKSYVQTAIKEQYLHTIFVLIIVVLLVSLLAFLLSRRFTENILILARGVKRIASGDFSAHVEITGDDEVGELARDFNSMAPSLREHIEIKSALDVAMEVQTNLLPQNSPYIKGYDIYGESKYCDELGGDYFDYIRPERDGENMRFAIGDVSGHGVPAAMLMGSVRGYLRARTLSGGQLGEIVTDVNRLVAQDTYKTGQFMTMLMVELDPAKSELRWVRAGHEPALIFDFAKNDFIRLEGEGIVLGAFEDVEYSENCCAELKDGQILILGTDGIWEASNKDGEFFGKKRLWDLINLKKNSSAESIASGIFAAVQDFTGRTKQEDDLTVVVIKKENNTQ